MTVLMEKEMKGCFDFFWQETNADESSPGYGLTRDSDIPAGNGFASIAATGYALAAYVIGVEKGYVTREAAEKRTLGVLQTFLQNATHSHGFFYHFLHMDSAQRFRNSEVSNMDTTLLLLGAITAGEYFGGEAQALAEALYTRADWSVFRNPATNCYHMGYIDETGLIASEWDHYAEHLAMLILAAGSPTHPADGDVMYSFTRQKAVYGEYEYIRTACNAMFVYQFSHAFVDFRGKKDALGVDWFDNSVQAAKAHRQYCIDNADGYKTYGANAWGLSACHYKHGYSGAFGAKPYNEPAPYMVNDGTIPLYGAVASVAFVPAEAEAAMAHYAGFPQLWGRYGLVESFNLDEDPPYFDDRVLGIDKGITLLMLANHESGLVWRHFMRNAHVQKGLQVCGIE